MSRIIRVDLGSDAVEATRSLKANTPEESMQIQAIRKTIEIFKNHLANLPARDCTLDMKKELNFGIGRVTVICTTKKGILASLRNFLRF